MTPSDDPDDPSDPSDTDLFTTDVVSMHLRPPVYPPSFVLVDGREAPLGSITTPAIPGWRQLLGVLNPLRSGRPAVFTLTDGRGVIRARIERTSNGMGGADAVVTAASGAPMARCEGHGVAVRTFTVVDPARTTLASIDGVMPSLRILDAAGTPRGAIEYEPPRHAIGDRPAHDTFSFHFRFDPTTPGPVRVGCLAAMVVFQTAP